MGHAKDAARTPTQAYLVHHADVLTLIPDFVARHDAKPRVTSGLLGHIHSKVACRLVSLR